MSKMLMIILALGFVGSASMASDEVLLNTVWLGQADNVPAGYTNKMTLTFNDDSVTVKVTCSSATQDAGMLLKVSLKYDDSGTTAKVTTGFTANNGFCDINLPQGLKFELDNNQIYQSYNGNRWLANLTRAETGANVIAGLLQMKATGEKTLLLAKNICENEKPGNAYEGHTCIPADGKTCYRPYKAQAKHCWGGWKKGFYRCGTLCAVPRKPKGGSNPGHG